MSSMFDYTSWTGGQLEVFGSFSQLPLELRCMIWRECLPGPRLVTTYIRPVPIVPLSKTVPAHEINTLATPQSLFLRRRIWEHSIAPEIRYFLMDSVEIVLGPLYSAHLHCLRFAKNNFPHLQELVLLPPLSKCFDPYLRKAGIEEFPWCTEKYYDETLSRLVGKLPCQISYLDLATEAAEVSMLKRGLERAKMKLQWEVDIKILGFHRNKMSSECRRHGTLSQGDRIRTSVDMETV